MLFPCMSRKMCEALNITKIDVRNAHFHFAITGTVCAFVRLFCYCYCILLLLYLYNEKRYISHSSSHLIQSFSLIQTHHTHQLICIHLYCCEIHMIHKNPHEVNNCQVGFHKIIKRKKSRNVKFNSSKSTTHIILCIKILL